MKIAIIAFSARAEALAKRLGQELKATATSVTAVRCPRGGLTTWVETNFDTQDCLIFVGSLGIAIRAIAQHVSAKTSDPAVIVIDECGYHCISALSGHIGGANRLTKYVANLIDATPIITTATDLSNRFAVDTWASEQGFGIANPQAILPVSAKLLENKTVVLATDFDICSTLPDGICLANSTTKHVDIEISHHIPRHRNALHLVPRALVLGVGCKRGTDITKIETLFTELLTRTRLVLTAFGGVCSIDLKQDEEGLLLFSQAHNLPFKTFSAAALNEVKGAVSTSAFVKQTVGVDNVCERSALLGAGAKSQLLVAKTAKDGVTMAVAQQDLALDFTPKGEYL